MDDATLVQQAVDGDRQAFAAIYDRYAPRIYDFLRSLLRDPDEAADALQDTFLVAGARLHQLRDPERLRPWLYAIARHRGLRSIERRARHRPLDDVEVTATDADPADLAADADTGGDLAALVSAAADGLGPRDRVILDLHMRQGLDGQDLGDAIGVSASHAYVLVSRLKDQVERSLGALLVARTGREECPELAEVLDGWDGRLTPVWRKRVARHADGCEVCSDRRRRLFSPAGLLGAVPAFALPAGVRDRVLGDLDLCSHTGPPWPGGTGGFPPPLGGSRRRWPAVVAAGVAAIVLLVGGVAVGGLLDQDDPPTEVAVVSPMVSGPASTTTLAPAATAGPSTTGGGTTSGPAVDPDAAPDPDPETQSPDDTSPTPTTTSPPAPTTTVPPSDTTAPDLTSPDPNPDTIRAGSACSNSDARFTTVSVRATDPSGVESVVLVVGTSSPTTVAMNLVGNGIYQAPVGPLAGTGPGTTTIGLTARATDGAGNVAVSQGSLVLRCDPFPQ